MKISNDDISDTYFRRYCAVLARCQQVRLVQPCTLHAVSSHSLIFTDIIRVNQAPITKQVIDIHAAISLPEYIILA